MKDEIRVEIFESYDQFFTWAEEGDGDITAPVAIDTENVLALDMTIKRVSWKNALKQFAKAFTDLYPEISEWIDVIREECLLGTFTDTTGWRPAWTSDPEVVREWAKQGTYAWSVEQIDDGLWYIFLNLSGKYLGRQVRSA